MDVTLFVYHSDQHLRAAEIDADRLPRAQLSRRWLSGGGMRKY
jgi:hypothetical protein